MDGTQTCPAPHYPFPLPPARPQCLCQDDLSAEERVLRAFDLATQFGPCVGITRMERCVLLLVATPAASTACTMVQDSCSAYVMHHNLMLPLLPCACLQLAARRTLWPQPASRSQGAAVGASWQSTKQLPVGRTPVASSTQPAWLPSLLSSAAYFPLCFASAAVVLPGHLREGARRRCDAVAH